MRLPEGEGDGDARRLAEIEALLFPAPNEIEDLVVDAVGGSALFASRFRENAGRALLLPRRRPGARTPLWQQRKRAADLLQVASRYGRRPEALVSADLRHGDGYAVRLRGVSTTADALKK